MQMTVVQTGALRDSDVRRLQYREGNEGRQTLQGEVLAVDTDPLAPRQCIGCQTSDFKQVRGVIARLFHQSNFLKCLSRRVGKLARLARTVLRELGLRRVTALLNCILRMRGEATTLPRSSFDLPGEETQRGHIAGQKSSVRRSRVSKTRLQELDAMAKAG